MKNLIALFLCGVSIMTFGQPRDLTQQNVGRVLDHVTLET